MADHTEHLQAQVQEAAETGRPLRIRGGGSKRGILGRDILGDVLDISKHTGVTAYDPAELVITARAGTPLSEIEAVLAEAGQALPFSPPHFGDRATVGGTVATNLSGPTRPWGGACRDAVLGVTLLTGTGACLRFGGRVMKNVAGYDLSRLQAGAMGALGVILDVSLKTLPLPETTRTLVQPCDVQEAISRMAHFSGRPHPLGGLLWHGGRLYVRLAGAEAAVKAAENQLGGDILPDEANFWTSVREHTHPFFAGDAPLWRFSVRPTAPPLLPDVPMLLDWGGALRWARGDFDLAQMHDLAVKAGGHVCLFRGGDRGQELRSPLPAPLRRLQENLKRAFDPAGIFNRGILYSWL